MGARPLFPKQKPKCVALGLAIYRLAVLFIVSCAPAQLMCAAPVFMHAPLACTFNFSHAAVHLCGSPCMPVVFSLRPFFCTP